jgi:tight adherence protein B
MEILLRIVVGLFIAVAVVVAARWMRRSKRLSDRADNICGIIAHTGEERRRGPLRRKLVAGFVAAGLPAEQLVNPSNVAIAIAMIAAPTVIGGWRVGLAVTAVLLVAILGLARWHRGRRTEEFMDRLPAFLERVRRLIMIGNTFQNAFVESVSGADPIVKARMEGVVRRIQHGVPFADSIDILAKQVDAIDLHMLAAYVRTNTKYGGRASQNLVNLITQLNNERRLKRELKAATSETRASAAILVALTVFLMTAVSLLNPEYVEFFTSDRGRLIMAGIALWPLIGVFVMKRILALEF